MPLLTLEVHVYKETRHALKPLQIGNSFLTLQNQERLKSVKTTFFLSKEHKKEIFLRFIHSLFKESASLQVVTRNDRTREKISNQKGGAVYVDTVHTQLT